MNKIWCAIVVVFVIYAVVSALLTVQYFFDRGDMKKAAAVIYQFKPDKDKQETLLELMANSWHAGRDDVYCETEIMSRYEGHVFVDCGLKGHFEKNNAGKNYQWLVDVVGGQIVAKNDKAKSLMLLENK